MDSEKHELSPEQQAALISALKTRFERNMHRHSDCEWSKVQAMLEAQSEKLWSLYKIE